jgi:high affinity Mn2+ porin
VARTVSIQAVAATKRVDITLFAGVRLWDGGEIWVNPEVDQGFGLSDTLASRGFPSGEAYKVGDTHPYVPFATIFSFARPSISAATFKT